MVKLLFRQIDNAIVIYMDRTVINVLLCYWVGNSPMHCGIY